MKQLNNILEEGYNKTLCGKTKKDFLEREKNILILKIGGTKYYYDDELKTIFKGTVDGRNNFTNFYKIRFMDFEKEIDELLTEKKQGFKQYLDVNDIINVWEKINIHKEEILIKEREYFVQLAYASLREIDENVEWKIQCENNKKLILKK